MSENLKVSDEILAKAKLIQTKANFLVNDLFSGEYTSTFKGRGIEFEEVREYIEGDDVRKFRPELKKLMSKFIEMSVS